MMFDKFDMKCVCVDDASSFHNRTWERSLQEGDPDRLAKKDCGMGPQHP